MRINVLAKHEIERIKTETEKLIEGMGIKVMDARLRETARKKGAIVDEYAMTVRIPAELLRELLSTVPGSYTVCGIDGAEYVVGDGQRYIHSLVMDPWIIDYETGALRKPSLKDVRTNTILAQKNPKVLQVSRMDFPVSEYSDGTSSLRALEVYFMNLTKHYSIYAASAEGLKHYMDIGALIAPGGELAGSKLFSMAVGMVSPMVLTEFNAELLITATNHGFAVMPTICPMAGSTSPYNVATTLLQGNVENIFLAAMTQMLNPGNPYLYIFGPSVSEMQQGKSLYYTMDKVLWKMAHVELGKAYNMPTVAECGGTLSHRYDMQSGAESMLFMLSAQISGCDILAGIGSCCNANGLSSEMIAIQSAWLEAAEYLGNGISFEYFDEGIESIRAQGQGGHFLMDDLTIKLLRSGEIFSSGLFDMSGGYVASPSILEKAHVRVEELEAGFVSPVPGDAQEKISRYFHDLYKTM